MSDHVVPAGDPYGVGVDAATIDPERVLQALRDKDPDEIVEPGVSAGDALAVMTVPPVPDGALHVPEQVYGTAGAGGRDLTMHLYARADAAAAAPGIVFVHGGGFQEGFPEMVLRYANAFAARGYVTAAIRYRLSGEAAWPANLEDAKCAVRWLRANAGSIGLDPERLGVVGNSAGGTLGALVGSTPGRFEGTGGNAGESSAVRAAVLLYPATDLRPSRCPPAVAQLAAKLFRTDDLSDALALQASPIAYVETAAPTLTFVGTVDPIARVELLREYHEALDGAGVTNELVVVDGVGHSFDYSLARWHECDARMATFLARHLGAPETLRSWS